MAFATDALVKDRLDEANQVAHDTAIANYITYANSRVRVILRKGGFDPSDIESNPSSYLEVELLKGAEADLAAGYLIQAVPREDEASRYAYNKPHILVTTGLENVQVWMDLNAPSLSTDSAPAGARASYRQVTNRRDYCTNHYDEQ